MCSGSDGAYAMPLLPEMCAGRAIDEQEAEGTRQVLETVAALPCVGFRQEDVAGQEDEDVTSGTDWSR